MAVLVEGISVVVRSDAIQSKIAGGLERFRQLIPNSTYCDDGELARVGFLAPADVQTFIEELVDAGLAFMEDGRCVDIAVCDQQRGPTADCDWLEFTHLSMEGGKVGAAWLYEGERKGHGAHISSTNMKLATPVGWQYEGSLSDKFQFVPDDATQH
jgi:hypothetical protein